MRSAISNGNHHGFKAVVGNRYSVCCQYELVSFDSFPDVRQGFLPGPPLADAAGEARAFRDPIAIFAGVEQRLSHDYLSRALRTFVYRCSLRWGRFVIAARRHFVPSSRWRRPVLSGLVGARTRAGAGTAAVAQYLSGDDSEIAAASFPFLIKRRQFVRVGLRKHLDDDRKGVRARTESVGRYLPELQETLDLSKPGQETLVLVRKRKPPDQGLGIRILRIGLPDHLVDTFPGSRLSPSPPGSTFLISLDLGIECGKIEFFNG